MMTLDESLKLNDKRVMILRALQHHKGPFTVLVSNKIMSDAIHSRQSITSVLQIYETKYPPSCFYVYDRDDALVYQEGKR